MLFVHRQPHPRSRPRRVDDAQLASPTTFAVLYRSSPPSQLATGTLMHDVIGCLFGDGKKRPMKVRVFSRAPIEKSRVGIMANKDQGSKRFVTWTTRK